MTKQEHFAWWSTELMEGEVEQGKALLIVTASVVVSMLYAQSVSSLLHPGKTRLVALLPSMLVMPFLPWNFSSIYLRGISSFFLVWLAIFRLLLLSFGLGPLSPSLPFHHFLALSFLPVKLRSSKSPSAPVLIPFPIKLLLSLLPISLFRFKNHISPPLLPLLYVFHFLVTFLLFFSATSFLGKLINLDLQPSFDSPYLSTSLSDFWGRRWNLVVNSVLRQSTYNPVRERLGNAAGVLATFFVSGVMHEVIYYYLTMEKPSGDLFGFFVFQGVCTLLEGKARRRWEWRLHPVTARVMVVVFVVGTGFRPMVVPMVRSGAIEKSLQENMAVVRFFEDRLPVITGKFMSSFSNSTSEIYI